VIRDAGDDLLHRRVVLPDFDGDDALTRCRHTCIGGQRKGDAVREAEPPQPRRGEDQGVVGAFVQFSEARVEVAANRREAGSRKQARQLRDAADAAGPD
jgi:hypothetical protein